MRNLVRAACVATAVLVAIAGQAIIASPASAIAGLVRVAENSVLNSDDKVFDVTCPVGTVITGGAGYLVASTPSTKGLVSFAGLRPLSNGSGFEVTAREADVNFAASWRAVAVGLCAPEPSGYEIGDNPSAGGSGSSQTAVVTCPSAGTKVIGAGAYVTGGDRHVFLESIVPSDDLTSVTATAH